MIAERIADRIPKIEELTLEEKRQLVAELNKEIALLERLEEGPSAEIVAALERREVRNNALPYKTTEQVRAALKKHKELKESNA